MSNLTIGIKQKPTMIHRNRVSQQDLVRRLESRISELESKIFELSPRVAQAELRAGRSDIRSGNADIRADQSFVQFVDMGSRVDSIESRSYDSDRRAGEALLKSNESDRRVGELEVRLSSIEHRTLIIEVRMNKIIKVAKIILSPILLIRRLVKRVKISSEKSDRELPQSDSIETIKSQDIQHSPHSRHISNTIDNISSQRRSGE